MICESPPGGAKHAEVESPRERGVREVEEREMSSRVPRLMNDDGEVVMMQRCNRRGQTQTDKWARVAPAANPMNTISSCSDASIHCS